MDIKKIGVDIENFFDSSNLDGIYEIFMDANEKFSKQIQDTKKLSKKGELAKNYIFSKNEPFGCNTNQVANLCSLLLGEDIKIGVKFDIPLVVIKTIDFKGLTDNRYFIITNVYPEKNVIEVFGISSGDVYDKSVHNIEKEAFKICKYEDVVTAVDTYKTKRGIKQLKRLVIGL